MSFQNRSDAKAHVYHQPWPLTMGTVKDMQLLTCERAEDVNEAAELMRMLGIHPEDPIVHTLEGVPK